MIDAPCVATIPEKEAILPIQKEAGLHGVADKIVVLRDSITLNVDCQLMSRFMQANSLTGSAKTAANKHGFLAGALNAAVRARHISANPCDGNRLRRDEPDEMVFLAQQRH